MLIYRKICINYVIYIKNRNKNKNKNKSKNKNKK